MYPEKDKKPEGCLIVFLVLSLGLAIMAFTIIKDGYLFDRRFEKRRFMRQENPAISILPLSEKISRHYFSGF